MAKISIVIILFQYISGMATGGQASNVSYSSVSQSSDGGICAIGSGLPSSSMWRHTSARTGPRRERAIRFRDAWVDQARSSVIRTIGFQRTKRIVPCDLNSSLLKISRKNISNKVLQCAQRLRFITTRPLLAAERKNIVSDATTILRMNIDREISKKHVLMDFVTVLVSRLK